MKNRYVSNGKIHEALLATSEALRCKQQLRLKLLRVSKMHLNPKPLNP